MTLPGGRIRAVLARLCKATTLERLIDPVLADLQSEYSAALRRGQPWRSRWIVVAGYGALLKAATIYASERAVRTLRDWPADDRQTLARTIGISATAMAAVTALLLFPPLFQQWQAHQGQLTLLVYTIPQGLPLAIPVGLTLGIFCGLGGRMCSPRLTAVVLAASLACSLASFTTMVWVIPAAGDGWRLSVAKHVSLTRGESVRLTKGPLELTLGELSRHLESSTRTGRTRDARKFAIAYQMRWALPCAAVALALFAMSVKPRRPTNGWMLAAWACGACLSYYLILFAGEALARQGTIPAFAGMWLPNAVFAASAAILIAGSERSNPSRAL